ncbi:MAG: PAS domain S-box protein [Oscillatoriales cyanobacterium C42_A2020_001]|nr:PAS domain S-box protein [Leptolyngbyaceae cyanobacterium C42_A2020_001]
MTDTHISDSIFVGDSEMAHLLRSHNWSQTPLGSVETWSQSLTTAVRIMVTSRQAMFVWWGEELINLYNDAYRSILGGKHPKALGQPANVVWREIWDQVGPRVETALRQNRGTYDEALLLIMERNGYPEETYYTFTYSPVPDDDGSIGGIICANTNDTARIIGKRQLALLKELAATTADARTFDEACTLSARCLVTNPYDLPFALIYLVDSTHQFAVLAGTSGIQPGHAIAPETVALDDDSVWSFASVVKSQQLGLISNLETRFQSLPTGAWERSPHQAVTVPIAPSGKTGKAGILVVGLNPFRLFDDDYRGFIDLIAAQIAASIANAQAYEEERKRAEALAELDRAKTTFFSNVSHEFRTPLTLMLAPLEDALQSLAGDGGSSTLSPPLLRDQVEVAHRNAQRLLKLVNTLLDFSRIEAGRIQAVYEPTDLANLTTELTSVFRSAIDRAGLRLVVDCPPLPEPVYVDRELWEKIVLNLLSNAFKFTFEGEIRVSVHTSLHSSAVLTICDTGTGIPADELPHIFERFHRVNGAKGRSYEGSGIGLSLVQELVHLHGGTIEVTSTIHQGTCFTVTIPMGYAHLPSDRLRHREPAHTNASRSFVSTATVAMPYVEEALRWLPDEGNGKWEVGNGEWRMGDWEWGIGNQQNASRSSLPPSSLPRILLADDNADIRDYLKRLLGQQFAVETVADGVAALAAIRQQVPNLVLTDVMMPEMDGFELLRSLRADPTTQDIPIILLSARAGEEARIEGLAAGADDYLIKPFAARELLARVEANLKLAQQRRDAAQREQRLRVEAEAAQQWVEAILSSISDGFYTFDRDWRFTYVNERICDIAGKSREELLGYSNWDLFPETVGTIAEVEMYRAMRDQTVVQFEYLHLPWNRWFEHRVYPSPDGLTVFITEITARKRAEALLQQARETAELERHRYQDLFNFAPDGYVVTDATGTIQEANQAIAALLAIQPDDLIHQPLVTYVAQADHSTFRNLLHELLHQPQLHKLQTEELNLAPSGCTTIPVATTVTAIRNSQMQLIGARWLIRDITQRQQAEKALRESEARFRGVVESNMVGIFFWDASGVITDGNEMAIQMLGYSREELQSQQVRWIDITPPEFHDIDAAMQTELVAKGVCPPFEKAYIRKDGTQVPVLIGGALIPGYGDRGVAYFIDITDRKQAEIALRQSEERARLAIDLAHLGTWRYNLQKDVVELDQRMCEMWGEAADARILPLPDMLKRIHPADQTRVAIAISSALHPKSSGTYAVDYRILWDDGTERWIFANGQVQFQGEGEFRHAIDFFGTALDITDRKQAEANREQLLAREQAAREAAEAASRIKDEFLAIVSHELRTPLNPILGWSKLLRTRQMNQQKIDQALDVIQRNAQMQAQLINDLLDVSRILRGKLSLDHRRVDLASTIQAAIEPVRLAAEAKQIDLRLESLDAPLQVMGDAGRLQQVIWNLLSNAVKFTSEGGRVDIRLERVESEGVKEWRSERVDETLPTPLPPSYAQITVRDTGKGIPPDFLPYVFEHFRQESSATTRRFGGLGLGLAIVRYLVELHGGTVQADSLGTGQGATFTVKLPLLRQEANEAPERLEARPDTPTSPNALNGLHILVVDDDTSTREFLAFLLELHGANVMMATNADEAIVMLTQFQPDVLLSDIGMPDVDGYMLMRQIRALPPERGGTIPAIALTAYAGDMDQRQALAIGFQQHVSKPVEPEVLIQAIVTLVEDI